MRDRTMQGLLLLGLGPISETLADHHSYGFRPHRNCADAIEQCFNVFGKKQSPQYILEGDIKSCFDKISHQWLLDNIPIEKGVLEKWLKSGYIEKGKLFPTNEGTPQGSIISPTMANMVLDGLQDAIDKACQTGKKRGRQKCVDYLCSCTYNSHTFGRNMDSKKLGNATSGLPYSSPSKLNSSCRVRPER